MQKQHKQAPRKTMDSAQAEDMVRNNISWMIVVAQRLLTDHALAEDAVQEAFISAFRSYHRFENRSSIKTWLHRITVNAALMKLRKINRNKEQAIDEFLPEFDKYECRIEPLWNQLSSIEDIIESEQTRNQVHAAINKLPDEYRNVLLLRDIECYNTNEVAELLALSENNVKVRLHRARSALKKLIEPLLRGEAS
ncbi:MAG: sigma-70 family RNA polymerase sigma factor [Gammaproteobacteria bacterium]|nr:sigma-70 family RNA polymerase sigma factor [Gammaproteobacteria bacterium]